MAPKNYSERLSVFNQEIANLDLKDSLNGLVHYLGKRKLKIFNWDEKNIAIAIKIPVELPPLGNFEEIDVRSIEPILIVINLNGYPFIPPRIYPDRLDFPKDQLAHLYIAKKDQPPAFCLVRENFAEWYSNKQLKDLVIRVQNWFRDAASGELSVDGEQFDPVRLEGYAGIVIYDYNQLATLVIERKSFLAGGNFAIGLFERNITEEGLSFKLAKIISPENLSESTIDLVNEFKKDNNLPLKKYYHFGYVVWSNEDIKHYKYSVNLPNDWNELRSFCEQYNVDLSNLESYLAMKDDNLYVSKPVIIGINRPKNIIGFSKNIEFFNFYLKIDSDDVSGENIINNIPVKLQIHNQPLSIQKANEISGFSADLGRHSLIVGCGALGSKIVIHLARSGTTNFVLCDPDKLSPHNLVRHALFSNSEGINKAIALKNEIRKLYPYEKLDKLEAFPVSAELFFDEELTKSIDWIFDFSASTSVLQSIAKGKLAKQIKICKAYISDFGNLGIMFFEGRNRNPRIDDLQVMLYAQYKNMPNISNWLKREKEAQQKNVSVNIGVGCNSETIVLSDDVVSLNAAYFSSVIKSESRNTKVNGRIYLNKIQHEPCFSNSNDFIQIPELSVIEAINDPTWQIRLQAGIIENMKKEMGLAMPNETGGVLIGCANNKTKTIHVVELLRAPIDSNYSPGSFFRGIQGLPAAIQEINELSGMQLGYIGEWHSHPFGPNKLSNVDLNSVRNFKRDFEKNQTQIPVFLIVVTPTHFLPYVF